jgi:hypothetical protein
MSEASARKWALTYISVIAVEVLIISGLWLFSRHFSN